MNLLQIPFIGFALAWDLSQAAVTIWPLLHFEHDFVLCCKPENLSLAKVSRKWIRLKDIGWLTQDQGEVRRIMSGKWVGEVADIKAYIIVVGPHWFQCHCPQSCCWTLLGMWYRHRHWRPPLRLVFKTFPACRMPCLSLLRLTSNYHYLPLFVRELSLHLQRLLKLAVAGWKY